MKRKISTGAQQGMAMIEGLIAMLIFSLGVLSIVGLQAVSIKQTADAKYRTDASFLANQTIGLMWADRANLESYAVEDEPVPALPNGKRTVDVAGSQVTVTITWKQPGQSAAHRHVVVTQISG